MPLGTIHWIPVRSGKPRKPYTLTSGRLRTLILLMALLLTGLVAASFHVGYLNGRSDESSDRVGQVQFVRGELFQLANRINDLTQDLEEIATREEQILVAGAGLNIDLSSLIPDEFDAYVPIEDGLFQYIDDMEIQLLLAERLAAIELEAYDSLAVYFMTVGDELSRIPSIWPVDGIFVSDFGARVDPFTGAVRYHKGIDMAASTGTPIYAPADGMITFAGWTGGWGLNVVVRHNENLSTRYAHCSASCAIVGQQVKRGDLIARVGSTGRSVAPHLHYEVLVDGVQVDPEDYIIRQGYDEAAF